MEYQINHVHIRSSNPRESASWYEKNFNAKVLWEREVMPGTVTVSMQVSGPSAAEHFLATGWFVAGKGRG